MSNAEAVIPGSPLTNTHEVGGMMAPEGVVASPVGVEFIFRSTELHIPTEALRINGLDYSVIVDQEKLTKAIGVVVEDKPGSSLDPRQIVIGTYTGQSTVEIGYDLQPEISNQDEDETSPLLTVLDDGGSSVNITLPSELVSTEYSDSGLAEIVARQANKDLLNALSQNLKAKRKFSTSVRVSGLVLAAGIGEGIGIATADTATDMIINGMGGAVTGATIAFGAILGLDRLRWGSHENFPAWAVKKTQDYEKVNWQLREFSRGNPIISLKAVESHLVETPQS